MQTTPRLFAAIAALALVLLAPAVGHASAPTKTVRSATDAHRSAASVATQKLCAATEAARAVARKTSALLDDVDRALATKPPTEESLALAVNGLKAASASMSEHQVPVGLDPASVTTLSTAVANWGRDARKLARVEDDIAARLKAARAASAIVLDASTQELWKRSEVAPSCASRQPQCAQELETACEPTRHGLGVPSANASVGMGWQAAVVTGLASFLQQRAQDEVVLWLQTDVVQKLCINTYTFNGQTLAGSTFFPGTCLLVKAQAPQNNISSLFAAALRQDLEALPVVVVTALLRVPADLARDLVNRLQMLRRGQPPLEVLAGMASVSQASVEYRLCLAPSPSPPNQLACALVAVGVLAEWSGDAQVSFAALQADLSQPPSPQHVVDAFIELVDAACNDFKLADGTCLARRLDGKNDDDRKEVATFLLKVQAIYNLVSTPPSPSSSDAVIRGGQLIAAVASALDAADPLLDVGPKASFDRSWKFIEPAIEATSEVLEGQIAEGIRDGLAAASAVAKDSTLPAGFITTISLSADLAAAKTAQDAQTALQTAAAPLGSWRDKHRYMSISVNAFVGGSFGYETPLQGTSPDLQGNWAGGAFAPVGLDFTWPCSQWTLGVFASALDVGQLLTSPVGATTGQNNGNQPAKTAVPGTEINVAQVLAPGAYAHTSLGDTPFTLGIGVSAAPLLRYYEDTSGKTPYSMLRAQAFFGVDLDLIPLHTSHSSD